MTIYYNNMTQEFINDTEGKGIAVVVNGNNFNSEKSKQAVGEPLGKITLPDGLPYNVLNYGKAIILDDCDFTNSNIGYVTFTSEYSLKQLDIYCFPEYLKDNKYQIIGLGTVLYPQYKPLHSWSDKYGVTWEVIEGSQYVTIHPIHPHEQDKDVDLANLENTQLRDNGCYVEINKWANNNKVVIACWSNYKETQNVGNTITLYVTYDENTKTNELGHIQILNNTDTVNNTVADIEINLKVKYYPPNTTKKGFMVVDWTNPQYSLSALLETTGVNLDSERGPIKQPEYNDTYYELYYKYRIWNDLTGEVGNPTFDENTETYNIKMPRFCQDDMEFYSAFISKYKISFFNTYKTIISKFKFKYQNLLPEANIDLSKNIGYIPVLSDQMMMHFSLDRKLDKYSFRNISDGSFLFTTNIYTPQQYAHDKINANKDNVFVVDVFVTSIKKQLEQQPEIKLYDNHKMSKYECRSLYNEEDHKFYIIYKEELYQFTSRIFNITENTIVYNCGDLYSVTINDNKTYELTRIFTHETGYTKRVHTSIFDLYYTSANHDLPNIIPFKPMYYRGNMINSKYTPLFSKTLKTFELNNIPGLVGTSKTYFKYHVTNGWHQGIGINKILEEPFSKFTLSTTFDDLDDIMNGNKQNILTIDDVKIIMTDKNVQDNFSGNIYLNYGSVYGEYEDLSNRYSSVYTLQKGVLGKHVGPNLKSGRLKNLIIYTKGSINSISKYTYWKNFPQSEDDIEKFRAVAEVDLRVDKLGNIVNVGTGKQPVITNIK